MNYQVNDERGDVCKFAELQDLDCFYINEVQEPYIRVPEHPVTTPNVPLPTKDVEVSIGGEAPQQPRMCNAIRIRTLHHVFIVPTYTVHRLHVKLMLSTEPFKEIAETDEHAASSNTTA